MGVRPTHFQIGTIIITLDLPIESHHHTSSSPLFRTFVLSYVWVAIFNQFCTRIFSIHIIQYRLKVVRGASTGGLGGPDPPSF